MSNFVGSVPLLRKAYVIYFSLCFHPKRGIKSKVINTITIKLFFLWLDNAFESD